eukprot:8226141-Pyramimonas_sp.AAC.1
MPLQHSSAPMPGHRENGRFDLDYLCNPFTDLISVVEEPFQLPNEWRQTRIDAAVARSVSKVEAQANQDAKAALRKEWYRLREIGTWGETGVKSYAD